MSNETCQHYQVVCINQYELIRKYKCLDCGGVMMCSCDQEFGSRFLEHQLAEGTELRTQERIPVTHGFRDNICKECRGLTPDSAPRAEIYGQSSKIKRFYWRELFFMETERFADWQKENAGVSFEQMEAERDKIGKEVLEEIKERHTLSPKYDFSEPSQQEIFDRYNVKIQSFHPNYVKRPAKGAVVSLNGKIVSPEAFVSHHYKLEGWSVMPLESVPLHALFGVMMWMLIEDPDDAKCRVVGFSSRPLNDDDQSGAQIFMNLPQDFGTAGYAERRARKISEHFDLIFPGDVSDRASLLEIFDMWCGPSENLRQYLWAHRDDDVKRARQIIEILEPEMVHKILRYLLEDYWRHYLGWPDLLIHRNDERMMVEVKSSNDKLSLDQKRWIADNYRNLKIPFLVAKLHRKPTNR